MEQAVLYRDLPTAAPLLRAVTARLTSLGRGAREQERGRGGYGGGGGGSRAVQPCTHRPYAFHSWISTRCKMCRAE
jgi:hypothetical protein